MTLNTWLESIHHFGTLAGMVAAAFLTVQYFLASRSRSSIYSGLGYAVALLLAGTVFQRWLQLTDAHASLSLANMIAQSVTNMVLVAAAIVHPWVRRTAQRKRYDDLQQLNNQLNDRRLLFDAFMREVPGLAFLKDQNGRMLYVNDFLKQTFGMEPKDVIGKDSLPWDVPGIQEVVSRHDAQVLESGTASEVSQVLAINNITRTMTVTKFPVLGHAGERLVGGIAIDITEELARKNRIEAFASIIELSPAAVYCYDEDGTVLFWNAATERLYGYAREEILGTSIEKIIPEDRASDLSIVASATRERGELRDFETVRLAKDGTARHVVISSSRTVSAADKMLCALIVHDVSQLKQIKEEIASLNDELTAQINELSRTNANFQQARDEALKASSVKSAFVANISHELRTPLSGILGMSELALREGTLAPDARHMVNLIHKSANALLTLVNDLLDLSKLEAGKMNVELDSFSPNELLDQCAVLVRPSATNKNINVSIALGPGVPEKISGDYAKMRQVLLSLLGNAVKFTHKGSINIRIDAAAVDATNSELKLSVTDTGIGIARCDPQKLFTPFSALGTPGSVEGVGLGLALSKRFVELLNGNIGFESEVGKGSTFWFTVPYKHSDTSPQSKCVATAKVSAADLGDLSRFSILSVEDNLVLSKLTLRQLEVIGVPSDSAATVKEAVEKCKSKAYDIVLMDLHLPDGTGFDATRAIKANTPPGGKGPVIIAMSAGSLSDAHEEAMQAGMSDFLPKPVPFEQLRDTIFQWLAKRA